MADPASAPKAPATAGRRRLRRWRRWRREYGYLALVAALVALLGFLFLILDLDLGELRQFGYAGIFLISLIGSASVVLPLPGAAVVVSSGQFVNDVLGLPFWLLVGIVASLGETIGELTGYLAGLGGKVVIEQRPLYRRLERWMRRHGGATIFVLATVPNPVFDIAGFLAGAVRMPLLRFLAAVSLGKLIKNSLLALGGEIGLEALFDIFD